MQNKENTQLVSVIIVNFNTHKNLKNCLDSIYLYKKNVNLEIIVTDNNSTDREIEKFVNYFPEVSFNFRNVNDGFASGCNYAAERANGKYLLFMNPDVEIKNSSLELLIDYLEKNENTGIVSGVMHDDKDNILYFYNDFPSESWELSLLMSGIVQKKIYNLNARTEIKKQLNFEVDWFHGAFIFIRKTDFEKAGKFNEEYFMYYEDVELCFKVKNNLRKKNVCIPDFTYYHSTKSSLAKEVSDDIYIFHLNRSKLLFIRNYNFFKRNILYLISLTNVISRILLLPFWKKYNGIKREKFFQLMKILKLYFSNSYLLSSKFEFIKK
ncbi:MAG: glycosyltransferase family 2 protein [Ignavibacteria bacterium]|nr:glycosyltransferase family 2 protein [Ignavibacteria bacterium]